MNFQVETKRRSRLGESLCFLLPALLCQSSAFAEENQARRAGIHNVPDPKSLSGDLGLQSVSGVYTQPQYTGFLQPVHPC